MEAANTAATPALRETGLVNWPTGADPYLGRGVPDARAATARATLTWAIKCLLTWCPWSGLAGACMRAVRRPGPAVRLVVRCSIQAEGS